MSVSEQLYRNLVGFGESPLVFLRNVLNKKGNLDYSSFLSSLSLVELDMGGHLLGILGSPQPENSALKYWLAEVGRLGQHFGNRKDFQSDTLKYHLIRTAVGCVSEQTRISTYFLPGIFKERPYEKLLDQLKIDVCQKDFDLSLAHNRKMRHQQPHQLPLP